MAPVRRTLFVTPRTFRLNVASHPIFKTGLDSVFHVRGRHDTWGSSGFATGKSVESVGLKLGLSIKCCGYIEDVCLAFKDGSRSSNWIHWLRTLCISITAVCSKQTIRKRKGILNRNLPATCLSSYLPKPFPTQDWQAWIYFTECNGW